MIDWDSFAIGMMVGMVVVLGMVVIILIRRKK